MGYDTLDCADDKVNIAPMMIPVIGRAEDIVGVKKENASHQHFFLFPQCLLKSFSTGHLN